MDKGALLIIYILLCSCSIDNCATKIKPVKIPEELVKENGSNFRIDGLELNIGCNVWIK